MSTSAGEEGRGFRPKPTQGRVHGTASLARWVGTGKSNCLPVLKTWWALGRQLAAEVFEDKVPDAADVALRAGPAAPAAAAPATDEALPALRLKTAEPQPKGLTGLARTLPAVLRSRRAPSRPPRLALHHCY